MPEAPPAVHRVALAGNPNVGKTTVFNLLTGLRQKVGNYPGVTVERKIGRMAGAGSIDVVDLPGTYSLSPRSMDEQVAYEVLVGRMPGEPAPDLVVCVVDATNLERNLYLVTQVMDLGIPTVVALNMMDEARAGGLEIDVAELERRLGVPVVPMVAARREGVEALKAVVASAPPPPPTRRWHLMPAVERPVEELSAALAEEVPELPARLHFSEAFRALTNDRLLGDWETRAPGFHRAVLDARADLEARKVPYQQAEVSGRYGWLRPIVNDVLAKHETEEASKSDRVDAVLTHRLWGPITFLFVLLLVFQAIFSWATPAMDLIEWGVGELGSLVRLVLPASLVTDLLVDGVIAGVGNVVIFLPQILLLFFFLGLMEDTGYLVRSAFIMDRVMSRVGLSGGSVVPLLSSFACAIPGIMAARTLDNQRDRLITIMVAPLMSCSARLPVYTLFIAAFLPAGALFGVFSYQGLAMLSMYLLGTVMAFTAAWVMKRFVFKGEASYYAVELPPYRMPRLRQVIWRMVERSWLFLMRAGRIILLMSVVLWFLASFPKSDPPADLEARQAGAEAAYTASLDSLAAARGVPVATLLDEPAVERALALAAQADEGSEAAASELAALRQEEPAEVAAAVAIHRAEDQLDVELAAVDQALRGHEIRNSFVGRLGRAIEPVMRPLGFDWKLSAGILSAFAAREVIISTLATIYSVGDADAESAVLREQLRADRDPETGRPVYTPLVAVSLLIFFVLALQCMSTLAIARRETNSWFWPAVMWAYMTGLAYLCSLIVYQGGLALGLG